MAYQPPPGYPPQSGYGPPPQHPGYPMAPPPAPMARRERKGEFAGTGCLVQGLGLVVMFLGAFAGFVVLGSPGAVVGGLVGAVVGLVLLVVGGRMALKWICGACKNQLADRSVQVCPTCHARLT